MICEFHHGFYDGVLDVIGFKCFEILNDQMEYDFKKFQMVFEQMSPLIG